MAKSGTADSDLGSYAVNSASGCPWFAATDTPRGDSSAPVARRLRLSKPSVKVTNMLFDQMSEYVGDEYWVGVLKRMSTGRLPKNFKIVGPELTFRRRGGKVDSVIIPDRPEMVNVVIDFFRQCGVYSGADEANNCLAYERKIAAYVPKPLKWGSIRRNKLILDQALIAFAKKKTEETRGDDEDMMELFRLLKLAAVLNVLTSTNVTVEENAIQDISVLMRDNRAGRWDIDFNVAHKRKPKAKPREKHDALPAVWHEYLEVALCDPAALKEKKDKKATLDSTEAEDESTLCDGDSSLLPSEITDVATDSD